MMDRRRSECWLAEQGRRLWRDDGGAQGGVGLDRKIICTSDTAVGLSVAAGEV